MDSERKLYLGRYWVTEDGSVTVAQKSGAGPSGRHLIPSLYKGSVGYYIRHPERDGTRMKTVGRIVCDVFGIERKFGRADLARLLHIATQTNAAVTSGGPQVVRHDTVRKAMSTPGVSTCPFPTMITGCMDYQSWDCPEMDPLSCGSWRVTTTTVTTMTLGDDMTRSCQRDEQLLCDDRKYQWEEFPKRLKWR